MNLIKTRGVRAIAKERQFAHNTTPLHDPEHVGHSLPFFRLPEMASHGRLTHGSTPDPANTLFSLNILLSVWTDLMSSGILDGESYFAALGHLPVKPLPVDNFNSGFWP